MKIGIIHFSDIHFVEKIDENSILKKKEKIISQIKNKLLPFDKLFLVISGDIAYSGKKIEYEISINFFNEIINELETYTNKTILLIGIPGNHDCNFSIDQTTRELILDGLESNNYSKLNNDIIDICTKPQDEYFEFQKNNFFKNGTILFNNKLLNIVEYRFDNVNIIFNCFNTSWLSKLKEQAGKLSFPLNYFNEEVFDNNATLKVNIIHHPINWQNDYSHRDLRKFLNINGDITLSGHEHQADVNKMIDIANNENIFIESAALQDNNNKSKSNFNLITIDLDEKKIICNNFKYSDGNYEFSEILNNDSFLKERNENGKGIPLNNNFNKSLEILSGQFLHKRAIEHIYLDDVFISPFLRTVDEKTEKTKLINFNKVLNNKNDNFRAILIGDETSGKTTLLKKIFKSYHDKGFIPIFLNGNNIEKTGIDYIFNNLIKDNFEKQYNKSAFKTYDSLDKTKLVIIIDDFHKCKLKEKFRNIFADEIHNNFNKVIYSSVSSLYFNSISQDNPFFNEYVNYTIVELSYELRYNLIVKWNSLGENELIGNDLLRKNESYDKQVKDFLGKNFLPQFPFVILSALQSIDTGNSSEQGFSFYYKYLIEEALKNGITNAENLQFYNYFLADYCYFLFDEKIKNISKDGFETYYRNYAKHMKVTISFNESYSQLLEAKIIKENNDFVYISYNYIYYYYVANYISNKIDEPKIKELIIKLIERLYVEEFSGIIVFISQLNSNPFILDKLEEFTNKYFDEFSPAKLSDDISDIDNLIKNIPKLILEDKGIEERRKIEIKKRDEAEKREKKADEEYLSKEFDIDEDLTSISLLNKFIRAIKTFEIFGQVIKKNWGAFDGPKKQLYVSTTFNLSMRILSGYFSYIKSNEKHLVEYIYYVADKREITNKSEIEKLAKGMIFQMSTMTSFGLIKRVSNAISHKQLKETFNDVVNVNPTNSNKLIRLAIMMDHFGVLPTDEISHLLNKDKGFNKYFIPKILLRNFVHQYLHMYPIPYDERNRICNIVGITIEEQRLIQGSSKEKKN
jgi:hypothetical protein